MDKEAFTTDAWEVVGRKFSKDRLLADTYQTATSSVGRPVARESDVAGMCRMVPGDGRGLSAQRNEIEGRAVERLANNRDDQRLTSTLRIGAINARSIQAEAGDLRRFRPHRQLLEFCGMELATIRSGTFRGQTRLSECGNARLRRALWMAGQMAILQKTNSVRARIAKGRQNTHLRGKAYTAIAARMARTGHGIIKRGEPDPVAGRRFSRKICRDAPRPRGLLDSRRTFLCKGRRGAHSSSQIRFRPVSLNAPKSSCFKDGESRKSALCVCHGRDLSLTRKPN